MIKFVESKVTSEIRSTGFFFMKTKLESRFCLQIIIGLLRGIDIIHEMISCKRNKEFYRVHEQCH